MTSRSPGTREGHPATTRQGRETLRFLQEHLLPAATRSSDPTLARHLGRVVEGGSLEALEGLSFSDRQGILSFLERQLGSRRVRPGPRVVVDLVGHLTRAEQSGLREPHRRPVLPAR